MNINSVRNFFAGTTSTSNSESSNLKNKIFGGFQARYMETLKTAMDDILYKNIVA